MPSVDTGVTGQESSNDPGDPLNPLSFWTAPVLAQVNKLSFLWGSYAAQYPNDCTLQALLDEVTKAFNEGNAKPLPPPEHSAYSSTLQQGHDELMASHNLPLNPAGK